MKRAKIIKFVDSNKKQIIFALFAFIYFIFNKNDGIIISVAPAVIVEGAKAAKGISDGAKAVKAAKQAGDTAKMIKEGAELAKNVNTAKQAANAISSNNNETAEVKNNLKKGAALVGGAALTAMTGGLAAGAATSAGATAAKTAGARATASNAAKASSVMPKNTNPNPDAITHKSSISDTINPTNKKNNLLNNIGKNDNKNDINDENEVEVTPLTSDSGIKRPNGLMIFGCLGLLSGALFLIFPAILLIGGFMTTSTTQNIKCFISNKFAGCKDDEEETDDEQSSFSIANFWSKIVNGFKYGTFGNMTEVVAAKIEETYTDINDTYNFQISIPLLSSSLYLNSKELLNDDKELERRIEYIKPLAMLQMTEGETIYQCTVYEVEGESIYQNIPVYEDVDESLIITGNCNSSNVGSYIREIVNNKYDEDAYFEKLKESQELVELYPDYYSNSSDVEGISEYLVRKIRDEYNMYILLNEKNSDAGEIPEYLMSDPLVNLQMPLKGRVTISYPFGTDNPGYEGFHNGVDVYSSDTTIYSAGTGVVTNVYYEAFGGGNIIEITHTSSTGEQYISLYAHLSKVLVEQGSTVNSSDVIGIMGDTGNANGIHLHFSFWDASTNREYLDPINLFKDAVNYSNY